MDSCTTSYANFIFKQSGNSPSIIIYPFNKSNDTGIGEDPSDVYACIATPKLFHYISP